MMPRMASQVLPRGVSPMISKTFSSRSTCPSVSLQMLFEAGLEIRILRGLGHLRQRLHDLLFGVVDVLEGIEEQVLEPFFSGHVELHL